MGDHLYKLRIEEAQVQSLEEFLIKYLLMLKTFLLLIP